MSSDNIGLLIHLIWKTKVSFSLSFCWIMVLSSEKRHEAGDRRAYLPLKSKLVFEKLKSTRFDCCWHIWVRMITGCQAPPPLPLYSMKIHKEKKNKGCALKKIFTHSCFLLFYGVLRHVCRGDKLCRFGSFPVSQGWGIRRWNQHVCLLGCYIKAVCVRVCLHSIGGSCM